MFKRKLTKIKNSIKNLFKSSKGHKKYLVCKECDLAEVEVAMDIAEVTCAYCVQKVVDPPVIVKKLPLSERFPRGWALRSRYVHTDGRVFLRGKETDEKDTPSPKKPKKAVKKIKAVAKKKKVSRKSK